MMIIYKAENKINGKIYIGKTIHSLEKRKINHLTCSKNNKTNMYFHKAIRKNGFESFTWSILCEIDSESKLNVIEKFYIMAYKKIFLLYNLTDGGEGASGILVTKETRLKISQSNKGRVAPNKGISHSIETRNKMSKPRIKKLSEETKNKMSLSRIGGKNPNFGKKVSEETRQKIKKALTGNHNKFKKYKDKFKNSGQGRLF